MSEAKRAEELVREVALIICKLRGWSLGSDERRWGKGASAGRSDWRPYVRLRMGGRGVGPRVAARTWAAPFMCTNPLAAWMAC